MIMIKHRVQNPRRVTKPKQIAKYASADVSAYCAPTRRRFNREYGISN